MSGLPRAGQSVELHEPDGKSSLGRVQSAREGSVLVAVPTDAGIGVTAEPGAPFEVVWPGPGGVVVLPTTLARRQGASQLELWEFAPSAPARFEQRRQQARIAASGPVTLTLFPDLGPRSLPIAVGDPAPLHGSLIDLSEVALQCVVSAEADDPVVTSGAQVVCEFAPSGTHFSLRGVVHSAWTSAAPPRVRVVVQFDGGQADVATLTRFITAAHADTDQP